MAYEHTYISFRDEMTDTTHHYHARYQEWYKPCTVCGKPWNAACVLCQKVACDTCLFNVRLPELHDDNPVMVDSEWGPERAEPDYEFGRVCIDCYVKHEGHAPYSWGWSSYRFVSWSAPEGNANAIEKGTSVPAGDLDAWVSDPQAASAVQLHYKPDFKPQTLNAFELKSLLAWMSAWQKQLDQVASSASKTLTDYHNRQRQNALRADAGIIDYSQYE